MTENFINKPRKQAMKKLYVLPISLAAALCASLLFSCSSDSGSSPPAPSPESSSSPAEAVPSYCVYMAEKLCLSGTNPCPGNSMPSEECPFQTSNPSSSSSATPSSSSAGEAPQGSSSSPVTQNSSSSLSATPSSSSAGEAPQGSSSSPVTQNSSSSILSSSSIKSSSSSAVSSSNSTVVSSSSVTINVNPTACRVDDNNVYYCQWDSGCYALDPVLSPSKSTCTALLDECKKYSTTSVFVGLSNEGEGVKCGTPGSVSYTLTCSVPTSSGYYGGLVAGEPIANTSPSVTCRGTGASGGAVVSSVSSRILIGVPNWSNPEAGTYNISAEAISGPCSGQTASCGTLTVVAKGYSLSCSFTSYSVYEGAAITKPEVYCYSNGTDSEYPGGLTWTGAPNWSKSVEGTYNISVTTSAGNCSGQTATCGTVTVVKQ